MQIIVLQENVAICLHKEDCNTSLFLNSIGAGYTIHINTLESLERVLTRQDCRPAAQ